MSTYFKNISEGINTTLKGMSLTWRHLWQARKRRTSTDIRTSDFFDLQDGMVTIQYPQETVPIPDNGRYRLHNEMDDCIVCDKCVKVCPVDCIEIEPIRAIEEVGKASDGSPIRLYAAKFDIDMAKCCYCGLCTTVCPTECLTMTKTFDYSELDVRDMVYNYANISPEIAEEKRALFDQFQKEKEALKAAQKPSTASEVTPASPVARPAFKPTIKPKQPEVEITEIESKEEALIKPARPAFQPKKPVPTTETTSKDEVEPTKVEEKVAPKLPFRPSMKPKVDVALEATGKIAPINPADSENPVSEIPVEPKPAKSAFRPTMRPKAEAATNPVNPENPVIKITDEEVAPSKPAFRPTMRPKAEAATNPVNPENPVIKITDEEVAPSKPAFRPTMRPKAEAATNPVNPENPVIKITDEEVAPSKPAFRPTMRPKAEAATNPVNPENPVIKITDEEAVPAKPAFRPTMKPKINPVPIANESIVELKSEVSIDKPENIGTSGEDETVVEKEEILKPKLPFRPTMKPKPKQE